jgi:hypothetical protein
MAAFVSVNLVVLPSDTSHYKPEDITEPFLFLTIFKRIGHAGGAVYETANTETYFLEVRCVCFIQHICGFLTRTCWLRGRVDLPLAIQLFVGR